MLDIKARHITHRNAELQELLEYSEEQQNTLVIYHKYNIEFREGDHSRKTYHFPTNRVTIRQFVDAIVDFEKISRPKYKWLGGIDFHHVIYKGIHQYPGGAYGISWGS